MASINTGSSERFTPSVLPTHSPSRCSRYITNHDGARSPVLSRQVRPALRCLKDESTSRLSYRRGVVNETHWQAKTRCRNATSTTTPDPPPGGAAQVNTSHPNS